VTDPHSGTEQNGGTPEPQAPSADSAIDRKISELEAQLKEERNKYLYLYAEFDNFKKRAIKERSDLVKYGWEPVARELLSTVDNLERAVEHAPEGTDKNFMDGLRMVLSHFKSTLQKQGVQEVNSVKQAFDPHLHEAVSQETSELPEGTVTQEHGKGYTLHGRLLRPARVVVSSGPPA
jgi:molecular chaperone GrpE